MGSFVMKTSVVMTTYNGEKYIYEMLESLMNQTRRIDEVLIFDDFIMSHNLTNWSLNINVDNLGWESNFTQGLIAATGDIIFPCDQDDIWHLDKVEKMSKAFENDKKIGLLVSGYHAFSTDGGKIPLQQPVNTTDSSIVSSIVFDEHYYCILRPGCTMAIKKHLIRPLVENWVKGTPHDALVWIIASLLGELYLYNDTFIEFRRHNTNASKKISHEYNYKVNECTRTLLVNRWYLSKYSPNCEKEKIIKECNEWCKLRQELLVNKKLINWLKLYRYRKFYLSTKKYIGDLYYYLKR